MEIFFEEIAWNQQQNNDTYNDEYEMIKVVVDIKKNYGGELLEVINRDRFTRKNVCQKVRMNTVNDGEFFLLYIGSKYE